MKYFYILNNMVSGADTSISGPRIKTLKPLDFLPTYEDGDGPYVSLKELKENSIIFKKLKRTDPLLADKICEKRNIIHIVELVEIRESTQNNMGNAAFEILNHVTSGKINNNKSFGVHLFNQKFHRIERLTKSQNDKGVWEAKIFILDPKSNNWILKDALTTFFPIHWSKADLLLKVEAAYITRKRISDTNFEGQTDCGIPVVFIEKRGKVITAFPRYV